MFRHELGNVKPLLHSTASSSLVGILSRWESLLFSLSHTCSTDTCKISWWCRIEFWFFVQGSVTAQGWSRAAWDWKNRHWEPGKWHLLQWLVKVSVFSCFYIKLYKFIKGKNYFSKKINQDLLCVSARQSSIPNPVWLMEVGYCWCVRWLWASVKTCARGILLWPLLQRAITACMEFNIYKRDTLILRYLFRKKKKTVHWPVSIWQLSLTLCMLCVSVLQDDEYVVYNTDQIRLKYIVQYFLPEDEIKDFQPFVDLTLAPQSCASSSHLCKFFKNNHQALQYRQRYICGLIYIVTTSQMNMIMSSIHWIRCRLYIVITSMWMCWFNSLVSSDDGDGLGVTKNPLEEVTAGLLDSNGQTLPLKAVHVRCKLMDLLTQVKNYTDTNSRLLESTELKSIFLDI